MFSSRPLDSFYAAHSQMASAVMDMTFSLTDPFMTPLWGSERYRFFAVADGMGTGLS
jgi:hypothetical protein